MIFNRSLSASEIQQIYFTSLYKYNATQWYLYINQSKNSTTGLDLGAYTYFASAKDSAGNENMTEIRTITLLDTIYPTFSNFWDNNATLVDFGTGLFNVTVLNTNGLFFLRLTGRT